MTGRPIGPGGRQIKLTNYQTKNHGPGSRPRVRWHGTENDPGRPYVFRDAVTLIDDFFNEVERALRERGIKTTVVTVEEKGKRK